MLAGERLPEQDADGPDVACSGRVAAAESLRCDVGECSGHVADRGQRVGLVELSEPEVEEPDRDGRRLFDEDVRGLHIAMDDPEAVGVR